MHSSKHLGPPIFGEVDDLLLTAQLALADAARIVSRIILCPLVCLGLRRGRGDRLTHKASHRFGFWSAAACWQVLTLTDTDGYWGR